MAVVSGYRQRRIAQMGRLRPFRTNFDLARSYRPDQKPVAPAPRAEDLIPARLVARLLCTDLEGVTQLRLAGRIQGRMVGARFLYRRQDVERLLTAVPS